MESTPTVRTGAVNLVWNRKYALQWMVISLIVLGFAIGITVAQGASSLNRQRCEADGSFVWIPEGTFIAGSDRPERDIAYRISAQAIATTFEQVAQAEQQLRSRQWFDRELPRQQQSLSSFCISRNLVTNADYYAFVQATGHRQPGISEADYQAQGFLVHPYAEVQPFLWSEGRYPQGEDQHPVVLVSYEDAIAFTQWKASQDGIPYRLPIAEEWEKAARGTDGRYFPWGNEWRDDSTNWSGSGLWHTSEIATFPLSRSIYGVEDMAGNVFEFTSTLQQRGNQTVAIMKGCSWDDLPGFCRAAYQHTRPVGSRHILFGFRLIREAET